MNEREKKKKKPRRFQRAPSPLISSRPELFFFSPLVSHYTAFALIIHAANWREEKKRGKENKPWLSSLGGPQIPLPV